MLRLYDEFLEDEDILALKDRAYRLHVSALIYCSKNLTDGVVSTRAVKVLQLILGFQVRRWVTELVEDGLWIPRDDGYEIRNYLDFNPSAATVKAERRKARERMSSLRANRAKEGEGSDEHDTERSGEHPPEREGERSPAVPVLTSPLPLEVLPNSKAVVVDAAREAGEGTAQGVTHIRNTIDSSLKEAS